MPPANQSTTATGDADLALPCATREILKGTLAPLAPVESSGGGNGLLKMGAVHQLALTEGETDRIVRSMRTGRESDQRQAPVLSQRTVDTLRAYEIAPIPALRPDISRVAEIPLQELTAFAQALAAEREMEVRRMSGERAQERSASVLSKLNAAVVTTRYLVHASTVQPIGLLSLERLEMTPAGIERGELVA